VLTVAAAVAMMGDAEAFKAGQEFSVWAGLVPRQTGIGGKTRLLSISKRGDTYPRTLFIRGARCVFANAKQTGA